MWDVIIVGAGPAGLSAALILGRCRRKVLLLDHGPTRNAAASAMHGYLTRDGMAPEEFLQIAKAQLAPYPSVERLTQKAARIKTSRGGFTVKLANGEAHRCRKLLLATGLRDELPQLKGIERFYGRSVHHCPYCDGWEWRGRRIVVYGRGQRGFRLSLSLLNWSDQITLCSDGPARLKPEEHAELRRHRVPVFEGRIEELRGQGDCLQGIVFGDGNRVDCDALFFNTGSHFCSDLPDQLGCELNAQSGIRTKSHQVVGFPGLYAAGNILRDIQLVIAAAAEGAKAAFKINTALHKENLRRGLLKPRRD